MQNYIDLLKDVLDNGFDSEDRTGVGSRKVLGRILRWDLSKGFPIITTRKVSLRIAFEETMFFLRGETNTKLLEEKKINIWKGNTSREFLDNRGLTHLPEGDMGKGYGYQWRHWEGDVVSATPIFTGRTDEQLHGVIDIKRKEVDQVQDLLSGLKKDPFGRRHIITGWNPGQLDQMALPPCHMLQMYSAQQEFSVGQEGLAGQKKLHSSFVMRSNDVPFGLPYNIMSYAMMNHMFSKMLGYVPGDLVYFGWDVHIYQNQIPMSKIQIEREPRPLPTFNIKKDLHTLDDILNLEFSDVELIGYDPHPDIADKPEMAK